MKSITFTFCTDPGHGWLQVSMSDIANVGLRITDFTQYSYRDGDTLYLEEDCDAYKFIMAYIRTGKSFTLHEEYAENTFIRNLPSIR